MARSRLDDDCREAPAPEHSGPGLHRLPAFKHGFAALMLAPYDLSVSYPDKRTLVMLTATLVLSWSLMLSQAMEAVTRAFYSRADFDLVLSSPVSAWRFFAVRIGAMAQTVMLMALALAAPFNDVAVWRGGGRWLGAYIVTAVLSAVAVSVAVALTAALFRLIGPKRTRLQQRDLLVQ